MVLLNDMLNWCESLKVLADSEVDKFNVLRLELRIDLEQRIKLVSILKDRCNSARDRARNSGMKYDIDWKYLLSIYTGRCALTGIYFDLWGDVGKGKKNPYTVSLDRIDSTRGYTKDNVRLVLWAVNWALSDWGEEVFDTICEARHTAIARSVKRATSSG